VVINSFLGLVHIEAYTAVDVDVDDDTDSGRIHHIDIEVDTLVPGLVLAIVESGDDEQPARAMNLVEPVDPLLLGEHGMGVWKKY
jgi:hypothetical protein